MLIGETFPFSIKPLDTLAWHFLWLSWFWFSPIFPSTCPGFPTVSQNFSCKMGLGAIEAPETRWSGDGLGAARPGRGRWVKECCGQGLAGRWRCLASSLLSRRFSTTCFFLGCWWLLGVLQQFFWVKIVGLGVKISPFGWCWWKRRHTDRKQFGQ